MKKIFVVLLFFSVVSCTNFVGNDTELAFINSPQSDGKINDIVWADGEMSWNSVSGFDLGDSTDFKKVETLKSHVTATVWNGVGYVAGNVYVDGNATDSIVLMESEKNKYELKVH